MTHTVTLLTHVLLIQILTIDAYLSHNIAILHIMDQRRILFWRKLQASSHVLLQLLASLCVNEHIVVYNRYGISAANVSTDYVKCCVWSVFEQSAV